MCLEMRGAPSELAGVLDLGLDEHVGAHGLVLHRCLRQRGELHLTRVRVYGCSVGVFRVVLKRAVNSELWWWKAE
jgi:hypothetical protein